MILGSKYRQQSEAGHRRWRNYPSPRITALMSCLVLCVSGAGADPAEPEDWYNFMRLRFRRDFANDGHGFVQSRKQVRGTSHMQSPPGSLLMAHLPRTCLHLPCPLEPSNRPSRPMHLSRQTLLTSRTRAVITTSVIPRCASGHLPGPPLSPSGGGR